MAVWNERDQRGSVEGFAIRILLDHNLERCRTANLFLNAAKKSENYFKFLQLYSCKNLHVVEAGISDTVVDTTGHSALLISDLGVLNPFGDADGVGLSADQMAVQRPVPGKINSHDT